MSDSMDFARAALAQRRNSFLSLSPATSDSYPQMPSASSSSNSSQALSSRPRRASSSASASGFKILKLGPVYWGEHIDENQEDFHFEDDVPSAQKPAATSSASSSGGFLSLAPDVSPAPKRTAESSHDYSSRRSSSASTSTSSSSLSPYTPTGFRVLRLGPVYGGELADEHKAEFYRVPHSEHTT